MTGSTSFDLILRDARLAEGDGTPVDIGISEGRIAAVAPALAAQAPEERLDGRLVVPGFVETHLHLDKACILDRCRTAVNVMGDVNVSCLLDGREREAVPVPAAEA